MFSAYAYTSPLQMSSTTTMLPALSLAFPEFHGRIRMDDATHMFCANDIVVVMTGQTIKHASSVLNTINADHPEFGGRVQEGKINGKVSQEKRSQKEKKMSQKMRTCYKG